MAFTNAEHQKLWRERRRKEKNMRYEAQAEEIIEQLHGIEQNVAIQRLVQLGAARFVIQVAQQQRRERLRELRSSGSEPEAERELSPIAARIRAVRKAAGYVD